MSQSSRPSRARRHLLTMQDAADELNVAKRTVRHYIATGQLSAIRITPRCVRIDPAELDRFVDRRASA